MILARAVCISLALAANTAAFVPASTNPAARRSNSGLVSLGIATSSTTDTSSTTSSTSTPSILHGYDHHTSDRLPYSPTGYSTWEWNTHHSSQNQLSKKSNDDTNTNNNNNDSPAATTVHNINYLELGNPSKPALLLVHGFGASSYHFRHNIPVLARDYHVYAIDLLGFGWSDKPIMDYDATVWKDQVVEFVQEIILGQEVEGDEKQQQRPVAIAGNSLGGYAAMYASSDERIKDNVKGCILLNAAGQFRDPDSEETKSDPNPIVEAISAAVQRAIIAVSFVYTKQPLRIEQILKQVYPINNANVDSELVESIYTPALEGSAAEVFYRVITKTGKGDQAYIDDILAALECPVLLAWGESDPWIKSSAADRMEVLHKGFHGEGDSKKRIERVSIDAGHCPHDEAPGAVNDAILEFVKDVF